MNKRLLCTILSTSLVFIIPYTQAEETNAEKAETVKNKIVDKSKRGYRAAQDQVCELVNGKMECMAKKMKHKVENLSDEAKTKTNEIKNEVD